MPSSSPHPQISQETPPNGEKWLSVTEAAAASGVSVKTIWRRAKAGEITARKVAGARGGFVWEVAPDSSGQTDRTDTQPTGQNKPKKRAAPVIDAQTDRPTGQPTGHGDEMAARLLAQLETENAFLRGVVEQLQRDGAETRAALRKALDGQPKQLTSGEQSGAASGDSQTTATAPEAPTATAISPDVVLPVEPQNGPQNGASGPDVSSYGALADWLEREILER